MVRSIAGFVIIGATLLSVYFLRYNMQAARRNLILPVILSAIALALSFVHVAYSGPLDTSMQFSIILTNAGLCVRSLVLGVVGMSLFERLGLQEKLRVIPNIRVFWSSSKPIPIILLSVGFLVYSIVLFALLSALSLDSIDFPGIALSDLPKTISIAIAGSINEELTIRLGLIAIIVFILESNPNKWKYAIIISSVVWASMHVRDESLALPKFLQIFPFGLLLGWTMQRFGFATSLLSHLGANILVIGLSVV